MKKVIRLTESDLIKLVKKVINEQTQPKTFKIGTQTFRIQKLTPVDKLWSKLEYVKVLPNGMIEKKLNIGYVTTNYPKVIFQSQNSKSPKVGTADMDLVIIPDEPIQQSQPESQISIQDMKILYNFSQNLFDYLSDVSGEYQTQIEKSNKSNETKFFIRSSEKRYVGGSVSLFFERGKIKVFFNNKIVYETRPDDPRGISLTSKAIVEELAKQVNS